MKIKVFGKLTDITQKTEWETEDKTSTVLLKEYLEKEFPELKNYKYLISVNQQIINKEQEIPFDSEIALLPPFSGG